MAKRSKKIDKFVALAVAEERRFGELTGRSRAQLNDHANRLSELNAFRKNYAGVTQGSDNIHAAHWQDYQNFLRRLDDAVRSQQQVVSDGEENVAIHRRRWMAKRQRLESLERVLERYQQEEYRQSERHEQRVLDDLPSSPKRYDDGT